MPKNVFQPGNSGRPIGSKNYFSMQTLIQACKYVEKKKGKSIYRHFVERAYISDRVLIALMNKIMPDLSKELSHEGEDWFKENGLEIMSQAEELGIKNRMSEFLTENGDNDKTI